MPWVHKTGGAVDGVARNMMEGAGWEWAEEDDAALLAYGLADLKRERKAQVDAERERRSRLGAPVVLTGPSRSFAAQTRDVEDKLNLSGMLQLAALAEGVSPGATIGFRAADNVVYQLTYDDCQALALQVGQRQQALIAAGWDHKDAIAALTTAAEVAAYDITAGWP